ncbi:N-terminal double-transmembrane domain-containing protein [Catalinimonas alkaloidigena]|uniref:N-terminal double-transmembrane domain-containing protein n=1 Tax=Catalinimonas alkaloidigena TaxID=1075417 RepID=A0A1G9KZ57_9BACT|nr:BatA domain-containing protein [Catalinimonas alkaloidigena]SDL55021.1 N-terminal double-transmembrane domain-containing protein [Catalinimonas alkaloidigena]
MLSPAYLWALWALLIPLAIHLWNRREGRRIQVGSIRWLEASTSRKKSSLRLHQWPLLLTRLLLLTLVVLVLVELRQANAPAPPAPRPLALIDSALWRQPLIQRRLDSLQDSYWDVRVMAPLHLWHELEGLAYANPRPERVTVYHRGQLREFGGTRPSLPFPVAWITLPDSGEGTFVAAAQPVGRDSVLVLRAESTEAGTRLQRQRLSAAAYRDEVPLHPTDTLRVRLQATSAAAEIRLYVEAALRAASQYQAWPMALDTTGTPDWTVLLGNTSLPDAPAGQLVRIRRAPGPLRHIQTVEQHHVVHVLQGKLDDPNVSRLPERLLELLFVPVSTDERLATHDRRAIAPTQREVRLGKAPVQTRQTASTGPQAPPLWLAGLLLLIFGFERWLATRT